MFEQHIRKYALKRNHGNALPRHIIAFDCETKPLPIDETGEILSHDFYLGTAITCRLEGVDAKYVRKYTLHNKQDFVDLLELCTRAKQTTWVIAHNMLFDFITIGCCELFEQGKLNLDWPRSKRVREQNDSDDAHCHSFAVINSPPTIIGARVASTQGRCVFLDTMNYFCCSLAELGHQIGIEKLTMPNWDDTRQAWLRYCMRDTEIAFHAFISLIKWQRKNNFGVFRYTAASQAWSAYRHRFMDRCIYPHNEPNVQKLERASYTGGRTECFRLGEINEPLYKLDVSSLYPSVMAKNSYPTELQGYEYRKDFVDTSACDDYSSMVAECLLSTSVPWFPFRTEKGTIYPIGTFATVLAGPELELANKLGFLKGIATYARFTLGNIFARWVTDLWQLRQEHNVAGDTTYAALAKLILNSLSGKFAERGEQWITDEKALVTRPWSKWVRHNARTGQTDRFRSFGWTAQRFLGDNEKTDRLIAVSSFINSYGRLRMNSLRQAAGCRNVYYQAVDGLIVNAAGLINLQAAGELRENELGYLRVIGEGSNGQINGIGDYRVGSEVVIAGRTLRCREIEEGVFEQHKFYGKERLFNGHAVKAMEEKLVQWKRANNYYKGAIGDDGFIEPFELDDSTGCVKSGLSCPISNAAASAST